MPAVRMIIPRRGREFWNSLDPNNMKQISEAVTIEVKSKRTYIRRAKTYKCLKQYDRPVLGQVHYSSGRSRSLLITASWVWVSLPCLRNCQIFLIRGAFLIKGQGRVIGTGCSYPVKDEDGIGLCGSETVIVIMEEGEQQGAFQRPPELHYSAEA